MLISPNFTLPKPEECDEAEDGSNNVIEDIDDTQNHCRNEEFFLDLCHAIKDCTVGSYVEKAPEGTPDNCKGSFNMTAYSRIGYLALKLFKSSDKMVVPYCIHHERWCQGTPIYGGTPRPGCMF